MILHYPPEKIAEQLTILDFEFFHDIPVSENIMRFK